MTAISIAQPGNPEGPNNAERKRELILENLQPGRKRLSLMVRDNQHSTYKIPVGFGDTFAFDETPGQPPADLVPVTLLRETPDEGLGPLRNGWLYVFVNDHLWRELKITNNGLKLKDVNLTREKGNDTRRATCVEDDVLVLPYVMDYEPTDIRLAYSEQQWCWKRIDELGGMNPEDPRQHHGERCESPFSQEFCTRQREQRLTLVDLAGVEQNFEQAPADSPVRLVETGELAHVRQHYNTKFDKGIASVIVPDLLGEARYAAESHDQYLTLLNSIVEDMLGFNEQAESPEEQNNTADRKIAALFNNQLFAGVDRKLMAGGLGRDEQAALDERIGYRDLLDRDEMETALEKEGCTQLMNDALDERIRLVALLDDPRLLAELLDFHALNGPDYAKLFEIAGRLIKHFTLPVAEPYKDLFFDPNEYDELLAQDPGDDFILRLTGAHPSEPTHPLHDLLFPKVGPDPDNPLGVDETEPGEEEQRLNPKKLLGLMNHLERDPLLEVNHDGNAYNAGRYFIHAVNTLGASVAKVAHKEVRKVQNTEQKRGQRERRQTKNLDQMEAAKQKQKRLIQEHNQQGREFRESQQRTLEWRQKNQALQAERERLAGDLTPDELRQKDLITQDRVRILDERIAEMDQQLQWETETQGRLTAKKAQVNRALENTENRLNNLQRIAGSQSGAFSMIARATFNHHTPAVRLYSLLAGESLRALSISHGDWMHTRLPGDVIPFTAKARSQRLKGVRDIAERIQNHRGPWTEFELPGEKHIRIPADLALEDVGSLHRYLAYYAREAMDDAEARNAKKIVQIALSKEQHRQVRDKARLEIVENQNRITRAETLDAAIEKANQNMVEHRDRTFSYEDRLYATKRDLKENVGFMADTRRNIDELERQLVALDESANRVAFKSQMKKLLLMNGGMVLLESFNLVNVLSAASNFNYWRTRLDALSALTDLAATIASVRNVVHEAKYGKIEQIKGRLANLALEAYVETLPVSDKVLKRAIKLDTWATRLNFLAGVLGAIVSTLDAYNRLLLGDKDAAASYGIIAVGFALTIFGVAYLTIPGFVLVGAGFLTLFFTLDSPLEALLKNSPYASDSRQRFGGERSETAEKLARTGLVVSNSFEHWRDNRQLAYHECLTHFFRPRVHFSNEAVFQESFMEVRIATPALTQDGKFTLQIQVRRYPDKTWHTLPLSFVSPDSGSIRATPGRVKVQSNGAQHRALIHREMLRGDASWYEDVGIQVRVRVKVWPKGEAARLYPGANIDYVIPAPVRNQQGEPLVDGKVVSEREATENAWLEIVGPPSLVKARRREP